MKADKFIKNSLIVTTANLVTGMLAFTFSIILSRKLGTEGMGLYGLVSPVYSLALCFVAEGLITALSKISATYSSKKDYVNLNRTVETTIFFIVIWSCIVAIVLYISSGFISAKLINDSRTVYAIRILCPALIIVPMSAVFKGYFYGIGKFHITSFIDISEKAMRVAFLVSIILIMSFEDVQSTVATAYGAVTLGELVSFTFLLIWFEKSRIKLGFHGLKPIKRRTLFISVLAISLPLCINGILTSILSTASTMLLPRRLTLTGITYNEALSLIGKFSGMALNITFFPLIIVGSMSTVLVPDISQKITTSQFASVEKRIIQVFKIAILVGIATISLNYCLGDELGMLFYNRSDLGAYIRFAALSSFLTFVAIPSYGILNGLGKQKIILRNSLAISVLELIFIYFLTPIKNINVYGLGISLILTSLTALTINLREIRRCYKISFPMKETFKLIIIGIITYYSVKILASLIPSSNLLIKCLLCAITAFLIPFGTYKLETKYKFRT